MNLNTKRIFYSPYCYLIWLSSVLSFTFLTLFRKTSILTNLLTSNINAILNMERQQQPNNSLGERLQSIITIENESPNINERRD